MRPGKQAVCTAHWRKCYPIPKPLSRQANDRATRMTITRRVRMANGDTAWLGIRHPWALKRLGLWDQPLARRMRNELGCRRQRTAGTCRSQVVDPIVYSYPRRHHNSSISTSPQLTRGSLSSPNTTFFARPTSMPMPPSPLRRILQDLGTMLPCGQSSVIPLPNLHPLPV